MMSKNFRKTVGTVVIVFGLAVACWCGGYLMLIGGIHQIFVGFNGGSTATMLWGFLKIALAGTVAAALGCFFMNIGWKISGS